MNLSRRVPTILLLATALMAADPWQELTTASALPAAEAEPAIETLLREHPGFHAARFNLGTLLLARDPAKAADQLQYATAAADTTLAADAWHNLALARWKLGQLDAALLAAEEAAKRNPAYAQLRDEVRRVSLIRADEARRAAEEAAKRLALATTALPEGRVGEPYRAAVPVRGGTPPYRVAVQAAPAPAPAATTSPTTAPPTTTLAVPPLPGEQPAVIAPVTPPPPATTPNPLPPGLTLAEDGTLSGSPTIAGTFRVPVTIADAAKGSVQGTIELVVLPQPAIATEALPEAVIGLPYTATLACVGLRTPRWSAALLPAGLTCTADGVIRGTPTQVASATVTVTANEPAVPPLIARHAERKIPLAVVDTFAPDANPLPPATAGQPYAQRLGVRGPPQAYRWQADDGQLIVNPDGAVHGTPAAAGSVARPATIHAADGRSREVTLTLPVNPRPVITTGEPLRVQAGQPIDQPLPVTGGTAPFTWSTGDGALPAGIRLDPDGHLRGVAKDPGTATVTAVVTDRWQARTQAPVVVQVDPAPKDPPKKDDDKKQDDSKKPKDDQQQAEQKPGDQGDSKPGDSKPGDQQKPGEPKPGEQKPGDQQAAEPKPGEQQKPGEKPGDKPESKPQASDKNDKNGDKAGAAGEAARAEAAEQAAGLNQMAADRWLDRLPAENRGVLRYQLLDGGEKRPDPKSQGKSW